jgi:hypothetical protein
MKLVEHAGDMSWKVHEVAWNLLEIDYDFREVILPKE